MIDRTTPRMKGFARYGCDFFSLFRAEVIGQVRSVLIGAGCAGLENGG
jgi:hypothetical protein